MSSIAVGLRPNRLLCCHYSCRNSNCGSLVVEVKSFINCGSIRQTKWLTKLLCVARNCCANIRYQNAELNNPAYDYQQDKQCKYNVTLRHIHATTVAE